MARDLFVDNSSVHSLNPSGKNEIQNLLTCIKSSADQIRSYCTQLEDALNSQGESEGPPRKKQRSLDSSGNEHNEAGFTIVYTDGGCIHNGQPGAKAGIGVYWGPEHEWNVSKRCPGRQTNNHAEIRAAIEAVTQARIHGIDKLLIKTDSEFMINCMTKWIRGWKAKGWKSSTGNPVVNKTELMELDSLINDGTIKVKWEHVRGHVGVEGNEEADRLATQGLHLPEAW